MFIYVVRVYVSILLLGISLSLYITVLVHMTINSICPHDVTVLKSKGLSKYWPIFFSLFVREQFPHCYLWKLVVHILTAGFEIT